MKTIEQNLEIIEIYRAMKYENSPETDGENNIEAVYKRNYDDCAYKIYTLMKAELEKSESADWQGMLAALEKHLINKKNTTR